MIYALDASALIAYLQKEKGGEVVTRILLDANSVRHVHSINLCEVYYDHLKNALKLQIPLATAIVEASAEIRDLKNAGLTVRSDIDEPFEGCAVRPAITSLAPP
jgi:PIN domain nuclease of toxin-antitoxin system